MASKMLAYLQNLPENLLNYCRFAHCVDEETLHQAAEFSGQPINADNELTVLQQLMGYFKSKLGRQGLCSYIVRRKLGILMCAEENLVLIFSSHRISLG